MEISNHAVIQFMKRSGIHSGLDASDTIASMFEQSVPVHKVNAAWSILRNNFQEAQYFSYNDWILVVVDDVIKTCYINTDPKKFKPLEP